MSDKAQKSRVAKACGEFPSHGNGDGLRDGGSRDDLSVDLIFAGVKKGSASGSAKGA